MTITIEIDTNTDLRLTPEEMTLMEANAAINGRTVEQHLKALLLPSLPHPSPTPTPNPKAA